MGRGAEAEGKCLANEDGELAILWPARRVWREGVDRGPGGGGVVAERDELCLQLLLLERVDQVRETYERRHGVVRGDE